MLSEVDEGRPFSKCKEGGGTEVDRMDLAGAQAGDESSLI